MIRTGITSFANDTFMFAALARQQAPSGLDYSILYEDLEELNQRALRAESDLLKVSFSILDRVSEDYILLPVGGCLIMSQGPQLIAREAFSPEELPSKRLGIPGHHTTAYLLLRMLFPAAAEELVFPYHELTERLLDQTIDCALTIHDSHFLNSSYQFKTIADLCNSWASETQGPLPLGGLIARRSLGKEILSKITRDLQSSLLDAWQNRGRAAQFAYEQSRVQNPEIIRKCIDLYVNDESMQLSPAGIRSIHHLLNPGGKKTQPGLTQQDWLFTPA
ncbi:MAG: hypothetical protein H6618_00895 [Deltaproteobacteria bacterium]|nr:hypothetical protein [Deltaproteobacteria bacterium]